MDFTNFMAEIPASWFGFAKRLGWTAGDLLNEYITSLHPRGDFTFRVETGQSAEVIIQQAVATRQEALKIIQNRIDAAICPPPNDLAAYRRNPEDSRERVINHISWCPVCKADVESLLRVVPKLGLNEHEVMIKIHEALGARGVSKTEPLDMVNNPGVKVGECQSIISVVSWMEANRYDWVWLARKNGDMIYGARLTDTGFEFERASHRMKTRTR